jgi:hypothetical protein
MERFFCWSASLYLLFLPVVCLGQSNTPKHSNEFLSIGVGARSLGMSNAQVSVADNVTAGFWNPAGLLDINNQYEFELMHASLFAGIANFDYAGFATPIDSSNHLGFSIVRFGVDDIPDTRFLYDANGVLNYDNISFFSAADYAFIFSFARRVKFIKGLKLGANFKVIHRTVGDFAKAWGFGLDMGAQMSVSQWRFGLMLRDITGTFNAWSHNSELVADIYSQTGNEIPDNTLEITLPKMILGVSRDWQLSDNFSLLAALDMDFSFDGRRNVLISTDVVSIDPHMGLEIGFKQVAYLRGGIGNIQEIKDFDSSTSTTAQANFGVGVKVKQVQIDYALTNMGDQSDALYSHIFSIRASFDKK